jgi:hypothetical protein
MTQDELNLVLDALKFCHGGEPCGTAEAIAVVEKALAQPEQECPNLPNCNGACFQCEYFNVETGEMEYPVAQPEQEPLAWYCCFQGQEEGEFFLFNSPDSERYPSQYKTPLYEHLPQRTWVGLTNKEVFEICYSNYYRDSQLVKMVEAKLKEKNT